MKKLFFLFTFFLCSVTLVGGIPWNISSDANLMLTENAYTDNWAGTETGAISWALTSTTILEKQMSLRFHSTNTLKLAYGQTHSQDSDSGDWLSPTKSTDEIFFESLLLLTLHTFVDPFINVRFDSYFTDMTDVEKTRYINPMTLTETFGVAHHSIDSKITTWDNRIGLGVRQHINRDVLQPDNSRETDTATDGGFDFVSEFSTNFGSEMISYKTTLKIFQALFNSESDAFENLPQEDYWKAPDLDWEHTISAHVSSFVMVNIYAQLLYDKEISKAGRFKESLALGITYTLK